VVNLSDENHSEPGVIYLSSSICAIGCEKMPHDDDCVAIHSGQVLESVYLDKELGELNAMAEKDGVPPVEAEPYVWTSTSTTFIGEAIEPDDPRRSTGWCATPSP